jgi:hypothetical protein
MEEIWKPVAVKGFESKYEVSNLGRVKSIGTYNTCKKGILTPMIDTSGYEHVMLFNNGIKKDISVHRLVALTFISNPEELRYVNHKDENVRNNNVENLEWCTNAYNVAYSLGKSVKQYSKKGELIEVFNTIADASKKLNIPTTNISKCCKGLRKSAGNFVWKYE